MDHMINSNRPFSIAHSQEEFDALKDRNGITIVIDSPEDSPISVHDRTALPVIIKGISNVTLYAGYARAFGSCTINAYDNVTIEANDNATIHSHGRGFIHANHNSLINAYKDSAVTLYDNSYCNAAGSTAVFLYGFSGCNAKDRCNLVNNDNSFAVLRDICSSFAYNNAQIVLKGKSHAKAHDNSIMLYTDKDCFESQSPDVVAININIHNLGTLKREILALTKSKNAFYADNPVSSAKLFLDNLSQRNKMYMAKEFKSMGCKNIDDINSLLKKWYSEINETINPEKEH